MSLIVSCPAKLNLFLAVGPIDTRGYHPIRSIFQAVGLYDAMRIDLDVSETTVDFLGADVPESNTVTKALRLMAEYTDLPAMRIEIEKRIPSEAGLGGGSSDGAGIIRAMRYLHPERLSERDALTVAKAVGADVPFFLVGGRAKATGYGDILEPLNDPEPSWTVIVKPSVGCSTPAMYQALDELTYEWKDFEGDAVYNDFERVAPCQCTDTIERLGVFGATNAGLSGSGSALFGLFESEDAALAAQKRAEEEQLGQVWVAPLLTRKESLSLVRISG
ncbi:MAG: 4-(cytidine 5'-diphospho)-2-C-methyl-D-erythritol kinase [Armatimonadetes bacterium 55-13]|nr:4-(cytidine 5'-diphospho)-2-C-methyl-D-erythritol kinase [Armatimonadota bacterium]OJU64416.1 MAG: 4-(cytidine 5'-diphospho)-2-C-methyl-D-erythritol kinase [Armatimonadetes bacterium 55-13]